MSLFFSILALVFAVIGLIPFLGILEWIALVLSALGAIFGVISLIFRKGKGTSIMAIIINILVFLLAIVRIFIGMGMFVLKSTPFIGHFN